MHQYQLHVCLSILPGITPCKSTAAYRRIAAVSMLAFFHSTHDLHQLKKVCSQQRSNAVDVYKRQTKRRTAQRQHSSQRSSLIITKQRRMNMSKLTYIRCGDYDIPVSYTHLDVYKRQITVMTTWISSDLRRTPGT